MRKKEKNNWFSLFLLIGGVAGGIWLISKFLKEPEYAGISGLPDARRNLVPYPQDFENDMKKFTDNEKGIIIRGIIKARLSENLKMPFYKTFTGTKITGEIRPFPFRILVYELPNNDFLMLNVFKKSTDETPKNEIEKAEGRLSEWRKTKTKKIVVSRLS